MDDAALIAVITAQTQGIRDTMNARFDDVDRRLETMAEERIRSDARHEAHVASTMPHPNGAPPPTANGNGDKEERVVVAWFLKHWKVAALFAGLGAAGGGGYYGCGRIVAPLVPAHASGPTTVATP